MRKRNQTKSRKNPSLLPFLAAVLAAAYFLGTYGMPAIEKTALVCAGLAMPESTVQTFVKSSKQSLPEASTVSDSAVISQKTQINEKKSEITSTPSDIIEMAQNYKKEFASVSHDGKIIEKTYDVSNSTSSYQNITVRNTTPSHSINIESSLNAELPFSVEDVSQPTVLIFHTHTTESYEMIDEGWFTNSYSTRSDDPSRNMVRVGTAICEELEKSGIGYIHDTQIHDAQYTGAYDRSRETIEKILAENPSIQIVLDVHRDAIHQSETSRVKPTVTINGKKAAQVMIIAGCQDGKVTSFPSWEQNLTFALKLHQCAENLYSGLMRPILFSARKYNMDIVPCSVLLEVGSDSNTLEEAEYSGHLIGQAICEFIKENK